MADCNFDFLFLEVFLSNFESDWRPTDFPMVELESWVFAFIVVNCCPNAVTSQVGSNLVRFGDQSLVVAVLMEDGNYDHLCLCDLRRQNESCVVRVDHNHRAD